MNFFEGLADLFTQKKDQNQGAGQAPNLFDAVQSTVQSAAQAVADGWTNFLKGMEQSNKQNIQAGNYKVNPEPVSLESPFSDNFHDVATAEIKQNAQANPVQVTVNPWDEPDKNPNPFGDEILNEKYHQAARAIWICWGRTRPTGYPGCSAENKSPWTDTARRSFPALSRTARGRA